MSIQNSKPDKPVVGLPFSADQSVRTVQHLANGMTLTRQMKGRVYRSADGLERMEGTLVGASSTDDPAATQVWIVDHMQHVVTLLNSKLRTATVTHLPANVTVTLSFLPQPKPQGVASAQALKLEGVTTTDIGKRTQEMMPLVGKRVSGTIPIGKVGNDQPIMVTTDVWIAPQLRLIVNQVESNPLVGERIVELTNIRSEEPDAALFQVPEGYRVQERPSLAGGVQLGTPQKPPAPPVADEWTPQIAEAQASSDAGFKDALAYKLAAQNVHIAEALALSQKAVETEEQELATLTTTKDTLRPAFDEMLTLSRYWNTLGFVYFRQRRFVQAEAYTRAAWELEPKGFLCVHLGRIYQLEGRSAEAIRVYRMALSADPSANERAQIAMHLTELGVETTGALPSRVSTPLPTLSVRMGAGDAEPVVDILLSHGHAPAVSFVKGTADLERPITAAIQTALAGSLPDDGPERVLRRARVSCGGGEGTACTLVFATSTEARDAGSRAGDLGLTPLFHPN